jgi:hypothetical protein
MTLIAPDAVFVESGRLETRDEYEKNHLPADIVRKAGPRVAAEPLPEWPLPQIQASAAGAKLFTASSSESKVSKMVTRRVIDSRSWFFLFTCSSFNPPLVFESEP